MVEGFVKWSWKGQEESKYCLWNKWEFSEQLHWTWASGLHVKIALETLPFLPPSLMQFLPSQKSHDLYCCSAKWWYVWVHLWYSIKLGSCWFHLLIKDVCTSFISHFFYPVSFQTQNDLFFKLFTSSTSLFTLLINS